jgi:hypothetical protein
MMNWNSEQLAALFELVSERVIQNRERQAAEQQERDARFEAERAEREAEQAAAEAQREAEWEARYGEEYREAMAREMPARIIKLFGSG